MIKIYLDHNVYQDLKKPENKQLHDKVIAAKKHTVFCFSEAHLYDLNQDKTDAKFEDMKFIQSIADSNCYFFSDRTEFKYRTPTEYYSDFDWTYTHNYDAVIDGFSELMLESFKLIPLPFHDLIKPEELPENMPAGIRKVLLEPSTFYDFMKLMLDFAENLTVDQPTFKEHLKFLHKNSLFAGIYQSAGIQGYDGETVRDIPLFFETYAKKFIVAGQEKSRYQLFLDMYHGLEIYGFVKGKPKKQKMMNLINDARHSFFGTVCDIIVSKDNDFLEKTRFMYMIENVKTQIIGIGELNSLLDKLQEFSKLSLNTLIEELTAPISEHELFHQNEGDGLVERFVRLKKRYFMYFNLLGYMNDEDGNYLSVLKERINYSSGTLIKQIEYIIAKLHEELGSDLHQKGQFSSDEKIKNKSELRSWLQNDLMISLILDDKLYLNFYPLDYLQSKWAKEKKTVDELMGGTSDSIAQ